MILPRKATALVVEDEALISMLLCEMLETLGVSVCGAVAGCDEAMAMAEKHHPDLVLMDVRLRGARDGIDAAQEIRARVGARIIFVTGSREPATVARAEAVEADALLFKPIRPQDLEAAVMRVLG
ncbi:MAG: response regulator [Alphaproteobacteria bacterium]|nr:response regulator [Alphaproteobacteria bacterium]